MLQKETRAKIILYIKYVLEVSALKVFKAHDLDKFLGLNMTQAKGVYNY